MSPGGGGLFSYGRPINEIMPALQKLTGQTIAWNELRFVRLDGGIPQRRVKQALFLKLAQRWADWWRSNWQKFVG